jgi:acetyl esterase/lipase
MLRLVLLIILFLVSLLAIFNAPTYHLWLAAILVTEFAWVFIIAVLILLGCGYWVDKHQLAGTIIGMITLVILLSPIVKAYIVAEKLKTESTNALDDDKTVSPFSALKMFAKNPEPVNYKTLTYVQYPDTALTLDFYPSQINGNKPCVIVIHGGSWSSGDSQQLPELNNYLARQGYNVASINYRLAPKYKNPAGVEDVRAAIKYLKSSNLNVDTNRLVLLGRSAGAQIALLAGYTLNDKSIKGVIDFYGPADMVWGYTIPTSPLVMDSRGVMEQYLGGTYKKVPQNYVASSPVEFVTKNAPPTLIIHGANDVLVAYDHSRRLSEKLQQNGVEHFWLKLPWATHGFDYNINGPGGQLSTYTVERFLKVVTRYNN